MSFHPPFPVRSLTTEDVARIYDVPTTMLDRLRPAADDDPRCVHCGDEDLHWVTDPSPDLCALCASKGLWSPMWGENRADEYRALVKRLSQKENRS